MNQKVHEPASIPCMVLTFTEQELSLVKEVLESSGYDDDLKTWILDTMVGDGDGDESDPQYIGAADRVIHNVSEFVNENPDAIRAVGKLAGGLVSNFLNKATKKGPQ